MLKKEILDTIENDIVTNTTDTKLETKITGVGIGNTKVRIEITGVGIDTPGVQEISHAYKNNEDEDDYTRKIADKYIPEEDLYHNQITSPTERRIYTLRLRKKRKHPGLDD